MRWLKGDPRVLLIGAERALLFVSEQGQLRHAYEFTVDAAGLAAFGNYLRLAPVNPLHVLVDVVEEEYRQDTVPHVLGGDRRAILARRFARLFRGTPYCQAVHQGREREGRRDDRVLLTALTRPEAITAWVSLITQHRVPLAGIYSLPLLSAALIPRLGANAHNVLFISVQQASGLRQTFFRDGHLRISRLAPMPRAGTLPYADFVLAELAKLKRYLNSLALASREGPLAIYLISHGSLLTELEQQCRNSDSERYFLVDTADLAGQFGLPASAGTAASDTLFAQLLLTAPPRVQYAQREETRFHRLHQLRNATLIASLLLVLGAAGWSALTFFDAVGLRQEAREAAQKTAFYTERTALAREALPRTSVDAPTIRTAVAAARTLKSLQASPVPALGMLGTALAEHPAVTLDKVLWQRQFRIEGPDGVTDTGVTHDEPDAAYFTVLDVDAHLPGFGDDYRRAMETVDALCARLRQLPGVHTVAVVRYPLDLSPGANVVGTTAPRGEEDNGRFTLRIVAGVKHAAG